MLIVIAILLAALANGLLIALWLQTRQAAQARSANLAATVQHLEQVVALLEAISRPTQRIGTDAQQPGDGRAALRERLALRAQRVN